jgi:HEAT repeat protein
MTEEQVMNRYGQIKMDIIYGRLPPKQVRLFVLSMIRNLNDPNLQPPLIEQLATSTDAEVKDIAIKAIEDMGA